MCGIAGLVAPGSPLELEAACRRMIRAQAHRGPDDEGIELMASPTPDTHVLLANRRLAVLDPSPTGHQPMANEDGTVWVVHNGEIYNFQALREELTSRGYRFRSKTDTEVIVHAYEEYGEACVSRFRGMFAFAVWDGRRQRLLLARDRLGEKPLYFFWDGTRLLFASEVRALLASGFVERRVDRQVVQGYLTFGSVPAPLTMVRDVQLLGPGSFLSVENGHVRETRYWDVSFEEHSHLGVSETAEALRHHLLEAVRLRLVSDVPLGAFLSGGVDSSAVVALMREAGVGTLRTFCLGFEQSEYDESPYARLIAKHFETDHTEHRVTAEEVLGQLDQVLAAMDQPSVDGVNTYMVSRLTRSSGTVVALSGLGGDELFGGYSSFWWVPRLDHWGRFLRRLPGSRRAAGTAVRWIARDSRAEKLRAFLQLPPSPEAAYLTAKGLFTEAVYDPLLSQAAGGSSFDPLSYLQRLTDGRPEHVLNRVSHLELRAYLHNQLLRDTDTMSMAHALEVRVPFLDHVLVEFVAQVPTVVKFGAGPKRLLLSALGDRLPREISERPKSGFVFPFEHWMKHQWRESIRARLLDPPGGGLGLINRSGLEAVWNAFLRGRIRWSRVWALIVLQDWVGRHAAGSLGPAAEEPAALTAASR